MTASEIFREGRLQDALTAALQDVKSNPADDAKRRFLCEVFCFTGDLERADSHLDLLNPEPNEMLGTQLFRQLIRAEQARQQFYNEGRLPEFLNQTPTPVLRQHLEASILVREGRLDEAARVLEQAEKDRPKISGTCDGQRFEGLRDLDDLTAPFFEVLTSNGKYYWIPMEAVETLEFRPPGRARELLWQRVHMIVRSGPDGEVFLPTLYTGSAGHQDERIRLGRMTDWTGGNGTPLRGLGQRMFLIGGEERPTLEIETITIDHPAEEKE